MKVLVTGGAGFVGANLVRSLLKQGHFVRVLDNFSAGTQAYLNGLDIEVIEGDILNRSSDFEAVAGMQAVIHLAAQTGVPGSLNDPLMDCKLNVIGTLNMLEASRQAQIQRFIFASSNAPLGRQKPPANEELAPLPISPYGASKLAGEGYCLAYHGSWGLGTVIFRFANLYGPFSAHKNSVIAKFMKDYLISGQISIDGDGGQTRDFIYIEDLCHAISAGLESDISGEVFQIATGVETSINQLARVLQVIVGEDLDVIHMAPRQGDIRTNYSSIDKIYRYLGWEPKTHLRDGLRKTWQYMSSIN